jgi:hypothetical protein
MKTIKISDELHDRLRTYSFFKRITMQEALSNAISGMIDNSKSSKVVSTTSVLEDLDWTDKEAQNLIDPSILEKFNL